ncbi:DUF6794 domain-containing protein [Imperialibacter roseus]|uniref:DUF6794 domain-containing protein n=1 Tax=Imperialibacter roseus TaxID=1324217 RepID=A0ABZ0IZ27_9BACT|nr:DUF6794 domain-containing protein [Imperialibacter roseus]WOK09205.1 DUF6794 domain-containing protein [Imperialibacter roseus]
MGLTENGLITEVIFKAFHRELLGQSRDEDNLVKQYVAIERKWDLQSENIATTDTLRGTYIPVDLEDCWRALNYDWSEDAKSWVTKQTQQDFTVGQHFGAGLWMRNNWGLWAGSRLARYFKQKGIVHPDNMSRIILSTYYQHLKGEEVDIEGLFRATVEDNR